MLPHGLVQINFINILRRYIITGYIIIGMLIY